MFGKSEPEQHLAGQPQLSQPRQQVVRVDPAHLGEEVGEGHRGVERHPLVLLGQREELGVLGGAGVRDHEPQPRVPRQEGRDGGRPGVGGRDGTAAGVQHHGGARLGDQAPGLVEQRVGDVEAADLDVHLEDLDRGEPPGDVRRGSLLGVERAADGRLGHPRGEAGRPVVEPLGHARLVRVGQRGEARDAERAQHLDERLVGVAVVQRPGPPDERTGGVELRAHLGHDRGRQEVGVDVDQPGQSQRGRPGPDVPVGGGTHQSLKPLSRRWTACSFSRLAWRSASECRLSYSFLPLASAISTLARPSLK